jgi:hypothetical protein
MRRVRPSLLAAAWLLLLAAPGAAGADGAPPPEDVPVAEGLRPFARWLAHEDWTLRSVAAYDLKRRTEDGSVALLARLLAKEDDVYVLGCALAALEGRPRTDLVAEGGPELAETLLRLSSHHHPKVAARAWASLRPLPPVNLGERVELYRGWLERGREALREEQREILRRRAARGPAPPLAPGESKTAAAEGTGLYAHLEEVRRDGLELCVVLDSTGSMGPVIAEAKQQAAALIRRLRFLVPTFRAGLVTYDDAGRLRVSLTVGEAELRKAFDKVAASGGGDFEEGVDKGIRLALVQEELGWSAKAHRVLVVVGDAPPHDEDVPSLLKAIAKARLDDLYDHPVTVHAVSTDFRPVECFPEIAAAGGGVHVTLSQTGRLLEELVVLTFGSVHRDAVRAWMEEVESLRRDVR